MTLEPFTGREKDCIVRVCRRVRSVFVVGRPIRAPPGGNYLPWGRKPANTSRQTRWRGIAQTAVRSLAVVFLSPVRNLRSGIRQVPKPTGMTSPRKVRRLTFDIKGDTILAVKWSAVLPPDFMLFSPFVRIATSFITGSLPIRIRSS
jgi:hypothetical protein